MDTETLVIESILRLDSVSRYRLWIRLPKSVHYSGVTSVQFDSLSTFEEVRLVLQAITPETLERLRLWMAFPETLRYFNLN